MIPGIHSYDNAVGRFKMLEGEFERGLDFIVFVAHPACRQYLETQAGLVDLPGHFGHNRRIGGKKRITDLDSDYRRHFFKLFRRPG